MPLTENWSGSRILNPIRWVQRAIGIVQVHHWFIGWTVKWITAQLGNGNNYSTPYGIFNPPLVLLFLFFILSRIGFLDEEWTANSGIILFLLKLSGISYSIKNKMLNVKNTLHYFCYMHLRPIKFFTIFFSILPSPKPCPSASALVSLRLASLCQPHWPPLLAELMLKIESHFG